MPDIHIVDVVLFTRTVKYMIIIFPLFFPISLIYLFWVMRFRWLKFKYVAEQEPGLIEIRLPKEIQKSPEGMELVFSFFSQSGAGNFGEAFLDGKSRPWFSCEIVSIGGDVKFFIWMSQKKYKSLIETHLYAQYPGIEIYSVDPKSDYAHALRYDPKNYSYACTQYKKGQADPYPIKSYIDYRLNENLEPEFQIDPLSSVIEFLGSLNKSENVWIQIMVQKFDKVGWFHGRFNSAGRDLKGEVKKVIDDIRKKSIQDTGDDKMMKFPNPTKGQVAVIGAVERNAAKMPFECMIRSVYVCEKDKGNSINIGGMINALRQFSANDMNNFKPKKADVSDLRKDFSRFVPFVKEWNDRYTKRYKKSLFHAYQLRSFFHWPFKHYRGEPFVISAEELATLFHFPSGVVSQTPTLKRIESKKYSAPSDLPV